MKIYIGEFEGNHWAVEESVYDYANSHIKGRKSVTDYLLKRSILCSDSLVRGLKVGDELPPHKEEETCDTEPCYCMCHRNPGMVHIAACCDNGWIKTNRRIILVPVEAKQEQEIDNVVGTFEFDHEKQTETYTENPNFGKPKPQSQGEDELWNGLENSIRQAKAKISANKDEGLWHLIDAYNKLEAVIRESDPERFGQYQGTSTITPPITRRYLTVCYYCGSSECQSDHK